MSQSTGGSFCTILKGHANIIDLFGGVKWFLQDSETRLITMSLIGAFYELHYNYN